MSSIFSALQYRPLTNSRGSNRSSLYILQYVFTKEKFTFRGQPSSREPPHQRTGMDYMSLIKLIVLAMWMGWRFAKAKSNILIAPLEFWKTYFGCWKLSHEIKRLTSSPNIIWMMYVCLIYMEEQTHTTFHLCMCGNWKWVICWYDMGICVVHI